MSWKESTMGSELLKNGWFLLWAAYSTPLPSQLRILAGPPNFGPSLEYVGIIAARGSHFPRKDVLEREHDGLRVAQKRLVFALGSWIGPTALATQNFGRATKFWT